MLVRASGDKNKIIEKADIEKLPLQYSRLDINLITGRTLTKLHLKILILKYSFKINITITLKKSSENLAILSLFLMA